MPRVDSTPPSPLDDGPVKGRDPVLAHDLGALHGRVVEAQHVGPRHRGLLQELEVGFDKIKEDTKLVAGGAMAAVGAAAALERRTAPALTFAGEVAASAEEAAA